MPDLSSLALFAVAALALLIIPGPAVLYIVARSAHQGRRAGLLSVLGVQTGGLVHVLAATVGLSAIVLSSAVLFSALKYLGAAYLIYIGIRTLLARDEETDTEIPVPKVQSMKQLFWQGALINALNPKTALFFLAFLPQFIHPERGPVALQTLTFGLLFLCLAVCSDGMYALLGGSLGAKLRGSPRFARRQKYVTGGIYIALGVGTATVGQK
ncbi:LysE family translocator [Deinococcus sp. Arct2-2]|uniref:LysE family translocator n=1 Tax=Deinococcus sp. Arct2-2 TaxID=2568653 RepID=UPI0010A3F23B|nr:LysE family translocator [Deinococcus sp. Arct2-2]THF68306.1 LysE family translocator [Deinococcus sp. Arct2-2]